MTDSSPYTFDTAAGHLFDDFETELAQADAAEAGESSSLFARYLDLYADKAGTLVNSLLPHGEHPDMEKYLYGPLMRYSQNGGKRHRPLICIAACAAVGGDPRRAFSSAAAIEHFHTAALIHDDIADEASLRRGEPCLHLTEGEGLAINAGDLALSIVNGIVMRDPVLDDALKVRVAIELVSMAQSTVEGQALDIGWARDARYDITTDDYLCMATHKTAHYSGAVPLAVGAIVGGGSDEQVEGLRAYGLATGLAFQIQDDLLNLVGTKEAKEKDFRSDITEGKRTLVAVHAIQYLPADKRSRLIEILSSKATDPVTLDEAVLLMKESGSVEYARSYAQKLTDDAKSRLSGLLPAGPARDLLVSMADWFVDRLK